MIKVRVGYDRIAIPSGMYDIIDSFLLKIITYDLDYM